MECLRKLHRKYTATDPEIRRYRKNWFVIYVLNTLLGVCYFIALPSMHQFVTSSTSPEDPNERPGLGLSETWYSWIVGITSVGEFIGAIGVGLLARRCYTKHLVLVLLTICFAGGIVYGIGKFGWMLLIGRLFIGFYRGGQMTVLRAYLGETSTTVIAMLPPDKQKESTIKYTNFFLAFSVATISVAVGPGLSAIAAQIPHLDQFRWSGYFIAIHSVVIAVVMLLLFREKWTDLKKGGTWTPRTWTCRPRIWTCRPKTWLRNWTCKGIVNCGGASSLAVPVYTIVFLLFSFFVVSTSFVIIETMENPILSDHFGFTIRNISYVFLGTTVLFFCGNIMVYTLQKCHVDNRLICLLAFSILLSGAVITTDWQSISKDPCNQFSEKNFEKIDECDSVSTTSIGPYGHMEIVPVHSNVSCSSAYGSFQNITMNSNHFDVERCTECNPDLIQIQPVCAHEFCCLLEPEIGVNASEGISCYWREATTCVTLTASHRGLMNVSHNLSCVEFNSSSVNTTGSEWSVLWSFDAVENGSSSAGEENYRQLAAKYDIDLGSCDSNISASCVCEAFSDSPYHCYWNPNSPLTGDYCSRCEPLCHSTEHSINFVQLIVGLTLLTSSYPMSRIIVTVIVSDALGTASQGFIMGSMVAVGAAARFTGPLWGNAVYVAAGRRTFLVMNIVTVLILVVIVLFLLLYRTMKPKVVHLSAGGDNQGGESEGVRQVSKVSRRRDSDQIELLAMEDEEDMDGELDDYDEHKVISSKELSTSESTLV